MSGAMCPDCGQAYFKQISEVDKKPLHQCTICGWIGNILELPRKILTPEMWKHLAEDNEKKKQRKLFFVRVFFKKEHGDKTFEVMDALEARSSSNSHSGKKNAEVFRVEQKPTDEQLKNVRAISGVVSVEVF